MGCVGVFFENRMDADTGRRKLLRDTRIFFQVYYCEVCDGYHVRPGESKVVGLKKHDLSIAKMYAQGLTRQMISAQTGINERSVEYALERMRQRFFAASSASLMVILMALGFLDPNEFVPSLQERAHA